MFPQIVILFLLLASFFLSAPSNAQKMGAGNSSDTQSADRAKETYMGHIERYTSTPKAPEGSDLPGATTGTQESAESDNTSPALTPLDPAELDIPQADFDKTMRFDRNDVVLEVIDSLTIRTENSGIVRLVGLDIPDFNPYQQGPVAQSAADILRDMLVGKTVRLYQTQDRQSGRKNRMNQSLYHVVIDDSGSWVQGALVRLGLARVRSEPSNPEMTPELYQLEIKARGENLGLWAFAPYKVMTPEQAADHINSYAIVEGTVLSAARKQNNIFLNFGKNWRDDFTVSIKPQNGKRFNKVGLNPLDFNGKTIRVRGWIDSYNGPHIEIDHPETIEIISP